MRVRRTKEEIEAGISLEDKRSGGKRQTLVEKGREILQKQKELEDEDKNSDVIKPDPPKQQIKEVIKEREVRVLGTDGTEKAVMEIIQDEIANGKWEWKEIPIDNDFRISMLSDLGKEGWKFAFIFEKTKLQETSKYDSVLLHRLISKKRK